LEEGLNINLEGENSSTVNIKDDAGISFETDKEVNVTSKENVNVETDKDAFVKAKNAEFDVTSFQIAGGGDSLVLYSQLKTLVEKVENHLHIAPTGPTSPPLNPDQSPIISQTIAPKIQMESLISTTD